MTAPTVGRVVYYRVYQLSTVPNVQGEPLAAIVAAVQSKTHLNLSVFDSNGFQFPAQNVPFFENYEDGPAEGAFAHWMPYQVAQAIRHAADKTYEPVAEAVANATRDATDLQAASEARAGGFVGAA